MDRVSAPEGVPDVAAIRARVDAATPGEWHRDGELVRVHEGMEAYREVLSRRDFKISQIEKNAEFIAHARTDIPALLDALDRERERAKAAVYCATNHCDCDQAQKVRAALAPKGQEDGK